MTKLRLLFICLLLAACSEESPVALQGTTGREAGESPLAEDPHRTIDEVWADLARGPIPGFAGVMYEGPDLVIMMTDEGDIEVARAYVDDAGRRPFAGVDRVVRVTYDFAELYDWQRDLYGALAGTDYVTWLDIDESENRLALGAFRDAVDDVLAAGRAAGVPEDAIHVEAADMIVRGTVRSVDAEDHELLLVDAAGDQGETFDRVIVHFGPDLQAPRARDCVEIQASQLVLLSDPPQIGARRMHVVSCNG